MKYLLIIFAIFSFLFSESVFASSRLISDLGVTASRQVVRSFSVLFQPAVAWDVVPKVDDRGIIRPVIDWATGKQEIPISFDGNVDFIERFYNGCVPNMSPGTNHRVDFVSPLKLELFSSPDSSDKYRQSVRNAIAKQVRNYEPEGIRFVDTILANDLVLFTAYPSCEIRNGGIKDCRWFVDLAEITKYKTFDEYLEGLALLKRWIPLSEAYDSLALMHLKKGSRFSGLIGKAALQTHPGFRDLNPLLSLPYSEQLVACQEMVGRLKRGVEDSFENLSSERQGLFLVGRALEDLQIQILRGGGNQIHVFYADNAKMFNLGIVNESSIRLDVNDIIKNIAKGVLH